jgi:hypothetical protein
MPNAERIPITQWKEWSDVFASATVIPGDKLAEFSKRSRKDRSSHVWTLPPLRANEPRDPMYLDKFCSLKRLDRRIYLEVTPTKQVLEAMTPRITFVEGDTMNFEVIEWTDGRSLVVCHNSRIIAGPWVAKINSVTIPDFKES